KERKKGREKERNGERQGRRGKGEEKTRKERGERNEWMIEINPKIINKSTKCNPKDFQNEFIKIRLIMKQKS
ncbi:hypothetical protein ACQP3F_32940, partial [Escherichia coli]